MYSSWLIYIGNEEEIVVRAIQTESGKRSKKGEKMVVQKGEKFEVNLNTARNYLEAYCNDFQVVKNLEDGDEFSSWQDNILVYIPVGVVIGIMILMIWEFLIKRIF